MARVTTSGAATADAALRLSAEDEYALRLLARMLARCHLEDLGQAVPQVVLDCRSDSNPSLAPMSGDDEP